MLHTYIYINVSASVPHAFREGLGPAITWMSQKRSKSPLGSHFEASERLKNPIGGHFKASERSKKPLGSIMLEKVIENAARSGKDEFH